MFKKEKYAVLFFGLLGLLTAEASQEKLVTILPLEVCAQNIPVQYQYFIRRGLLNDVVECTWSGTELRKWLLPFCVQCLFSCALEEKYLWDSREEQGGRPFLELSPGAQERAIAFADRKVKEFFSRVPCATLETVKSTELWQSTILGQEPVSQQDIDEMIEEVLNAIMEK